MNVNGGEEHGDLLSPYRKKTTLVVDFVIVCETGGPKTSARSATLVIFWGEGRGVDDAQIKGKKSKTFERDIAGISEREKGGGGGSADVQAKRSS
jgi:hypothetical protein